MKRLGVEHIKTGYEEPDYLLIADNTQVKQFTKLQSHFCSGGQRSITRF